MAKPGTTKASKERAKKLKAKKAFREANKKYNQKGLGGVAALKKMRKNYKQTKGAIPRGARQPGMSAAKKRAAQQRASQKGKKTKQQKLGGV